MLPARIDEANNFYQYLGRHYVRNDRDDGLPRFTHLTCLDYTFSQTGVCPICTYAALVRREHGAAQARRFEPAQRTLVNVVDMQNTPPQGVQIAELVPSVMSAMLQYIDADCPSAILSPKMGRVLDITRRRRNDEILSLTYEVSISEPQASIDLSKLMRYRHNLRNEIVQNSEGEYARALEFLIEHSGLSTKEKPPEPPLILTPDEITERLSSRRKLVL